MVSTVLLLDELVVMDISGEECLLLSGVTALGDLSEGASELVLRVLAGDVSAVAWDLCSVIDLTHLRNYL